MEVRLEVENVKGGGCARSIEKALDAESDVRDEACATLARLGYPEAGSLEGQRAAGAAAKSFVSCAIGRISGAV